MNIEINNLPLKKEMRLEAWKVIEPDIAYMYSEGDFSHNRETIPPSACL